MTVPVFPYWYINNNKQVLWSFFQYNLGESVQNN